MPPKHRSSNRVDEQTTAEDQAKHRSVAQPELARAMHEIARSSAAAPHQTDPRRKPRSAARRWATRPQAPPTTTTSGRRTP